MSSVTEEKRELQELTLGALGERIQGPCHTLGIVSGIKEAADKLRKKSGDLFAAGKDADARLYRQMAEELEKESVQKRKHYDEVERPRGEAAFAELDARDKEQSQKKQA